MREDNMHDQSLARRGQERHTKLPHDAGQKQKSLAIRVQAERSSKQRGSVGGGINMSLRGYRTGPVIWV